MKRCTLSYIFLRETGGCQVHFRGVFFPLEVLAGDIRIAIEPTRVLFSIPVDLCNDRVSHGTLRTTHQGQAFQRYFVRVYRSLEGYYRRAVSVGQGGSLGELDAPGAGASGTFIALGQQHDGRASPARFVIRRSWLGSRDTGHGPPLSAMLWAQSTKMAGSKKIRR